MKRLVLNIGLLFFSVAFLQNKSLVAQTSDTLTQTNTQQVTDRIEDIASGTDLSLDYSDLVDDYQYYTKNPLNINNQNDIETLVELLLINRMQADKLRVYLLKFGPFQSIYELKYVKDFDEKTLQKIEPFITAKPVVHAQKLKLSSVFKYGKNRLIVRYGSLLQKPAGYNSPPDSAIKTPGSVYLGTPQKLYLRYGFDYRKKIRFGWTMDKDAGEVFFKNKLPEPVKQRVGNKITPFFDFYSGYAYASDLGFVKKVVAGDYHLEFGQGLTLWSGLSFGMSSDAATIKKYGRGIRPNTSANENRFFRGGAAQLGWKNFDFTGFYSQNSVDANLSQTDSLTGFEITGIQETGNHRTINELIDKRSTKIVAYGGHLQYKATLFSLGATAYKTHLNPPLLPEMQPYKTFAFQGDELFVYGFNANVVLGKWDMFGEFSSNATGGKAGIAGVNAYLSDRFTLTALYRNIGKSFHNLYNNPVAESSSPAGESGLYLGINTLLSSQFTLSAYADYFRFSWLKYRVNAPSAGRAYLVQLNYSPLRNLHAYFRFRYKTKQENSTIEGSYLSALKRVQRSDWRWNLNWQLTNFLILKNRVEYVRFANNQNREQGFLIYQDILYRPANFPLQATLRYALFDTDGWDSRIYAYESDALYAFTVPAYYDKGRRFYLLLQWKARNNLNVWFRFAQTFFYNKTVIGSGTDQISGHQKSDIKIQVIWKIG